MWASYYGRKATVRTLLQGGAHVNSKDNVRNQMMMIMVMIIVKVLTMMMMMMMMIVVIMMRMEMIVDNDDRRSMYLC
jgi:hypothetical protein